VTGRELIETKLGKTEFTLMMSMTMAVVALAIDIVLPAFGDMREGFGLASDSNDIAAVITFFFFGLAAGQLLWGPLSDAFGRKKILYLGLAVYLIAAVASALAPSLQFLFICRFIWGIGAAGPQVVARSIVRDTYEGAAMARAMSFIMAIFILVPIIAPTLGSIILLAGTWRWVFGFTALFGAGIALWTLRLPETLPVERRIPFRARRLTTAARFVVTNRMAMGYTLAQMTVFGFFASYLASSQLILDDVFGIDALFPVIFGASAAVMGVFMLMNTKLLKRFELRKLVRSVFVVYLVGGLGLAAVAYATDGTPSIFLFYAAMLPIFIGHALLIPNLNAIAMIPMGAVAGMAAAIIGTMATLGGAVIGTFIDRAFDGTITPFATAAAISGVVAFGLMLWADAGYDKSVDKGSQIADERARKATDLAGLAPITGMDA
jgi:DHA1 family bicyclomycin/chloramphenicol resistance-like MFS transporter